MAQRQQERQGTPLGTDWLPLRGWQHNSLELNQALASEGFMACSETRAPALHPGLNGEQQVFFKIMKAVADLNRHDGCLPENITSITLYAAWAHEQDLLSEAEAVALEQALDDLQDRFPEGDAPSFDDMYGEGGEN